MSSKGRAILDCKCPRCRAGDMFVSPLFKSYFNRNMHDKCPMCAQTYEPEPGFFFGAMYISYAFSVAIMFTIGFVLYNFFGDPDMSVYMTTVVVVIALFWPVMYRFSRSIYFHLFGGVKYNPDILKSK